MDGGEDRADRPASPPSSPSPTPPQTAPGRHSLVERFLARLFEDRFLTDPTAPTTSDEPSPPPSSPSPHPDLAPQIPFFPAVAPASHMSPAEARHVVFCVEDTVGLKDDKFSVGVVDRSFGDVDSHSPRPQRDYSEDIERHADIPVADFNKFMKTGIPPRGAVLISWQTQFKTELIPEEKLELLDRALYVGDVVKRNAKDHMSGTVIGTRAGCTLFPATLFDGGRITQTEDFSIRGVPAEELINVHEFNEGALVVYNDWIGRIEQVYDEVAIKLSNNSVVIVEDPDELVADDAMVDRLSVGDTVSTKKGNLRRGRWKYGAFDPNVRPQGMVVETRPIFLDVHWITRKIGAPFVLPNLNLGGQEPHTRLVVEELEGAAFHVYDASGASATTLPVSSNGTDPSYHVAEVAVGDRVRFKDLHGAAVKYDGTKTLPNGYPQGKLGRIPRTETLGYDMNVFIVMQTHTQVTVQWQDLSVTEDISSTLLPDPNVEDDDEVWPGEIICTKEQQQAADESVAWTFKPAKVGVVQAVKSHDRIATVRWFTNPNVHFLGDDLIPPCDTGTLSEAVEDVSLYDIRSTPSLTRRRNDFVMIHPDTLEPLPNPIDGPDWFGEVIDLGLDGKLTVRLGAAKPVVDVRVPAEKVTLVYSSDMDNPFLNMPPVEDGLEEDSEGEYESDFDSASFNEMWIEYEGMDGEPIGDSNDEDWSTEYEEDEDDDDDSMPDLEPVDPVDTSKTTPEAPSDADRKPQSSEDHDMSGMLSPAAEEPKPSSGSSADNGNDSNGSASFLILDTAPPADHQYLSHTTTSSVAFMRRIAKEHKILRSSLPPGIFVRTWESRLDLIRVLMIGPSDTPYEYAPFVIDFHIGSDYPQHPPEAFFHSWTNGNGPVNPNLYEDGKICLSLLGTWHADERNESWSPAKSTLLQVLVSIMGLVLVKEPYYNEAGYDVHREAPETKLNSALYTERAYFRARAFIAYALTNEVQPFTEELRYMYRDQSPGAPRLLDKAIDAAKEVIERSSGGTDEGERDGLRKISLGAVVMLRRQMEKLQSLKEQISSASS
ncbi:hypothetical protein BS50DRAFT_569813 [Corynespora cassiicola Philippines]|uniref:UBC core domain-containing protein n=1 Tax=Corynespora cassiicola Philippines TaxID=1448308 RepID=A0A2T2P4Q0_CORCC|nr:hypothetical protein BS50DRAFT_569813 [Corynespora cassiicola Philippines]